MYINRATPFRFRMQRSIIMKTSTKCWFQSRIAMFTAKCNAARNESICKYRPKPSGNVSESENCVVTAKKSLPILPNLHFGIKKEFVTFNVGTASSRTFQNKDMVCNVSYHGGTNKKRTECLFEVAGLLLKVCRPGNRKLTEELL